MNPLKSKSIIELKSIIFKNINNSHHRYILDTWARVLSPGLKHYNRITFNEALYASFNPSKSCWKKDLAGVRWSNVSGACCGGGVSTKVTVGRMPSCWRQRASSNVQGWSKPYINSF